jgi:hypothetical protein
MIQKQLLIFFLLAYALTWTVFIGVGIPNPENPLVLLGVWGPSIAALLLTAVWGRGAGLKQLLGRLLIWRVGFQWYALMIIGFPLLATCAVVMSNWLTWSPIWKAIINTFRPLETSMPPMAQRANKKRAIGSDRCPSPPLLNLGGGYI